MASLKVLVVWSLLYFMSQMCYYQTQNYPYVSFKGMVLANHSYVNLLLVNNTETQSGSVQCHTDLGTCCKAAAGVHRGDWFFPVLGFISSDDVNDDIVEYRAPQRVDIQRRNNGSASGIYHCSIATVSFHNNDNTLRDHVYVGLYDSGGRYNPKINKLWYDIVALLSL